MSTQPSPFGDALRTRRRERGLSLRALGRQIHYSKGYLSKVELGGKPPTADLATRCDEALGTGDTLARLAAEQRSHSCAPVSAPGVTTAFVIDADAVTTGTLADAAAGGTGEIRLPWPAEPVADGADPQRAGCEVDAVTVDACRVAISDSHVIGQIQLRFSPAKRAAWGRFQGTSALDHFSHRHRVEIVIDMRRGPHHHLNTWRCDYVSDFMWCDLLTVGSVPVGASAEVYFDGWLVGEAHTCRLAERSATPHS